jgi:hypothetical protein
MADRQLSALLQKIADALGLPVESFADDSDGPGSECFEPRAEEIAHLVEAFAQVKDLEARRICIEFIRLQRTTPQDR